MFETKGSESNEFKDMVVELMTSAGFFNIGDFIPSIAWMDLQGIERGMKKLHKKFDVLITEMIEQHAATAHHRKGKPDFLDAVMANSELPDGERLTVNNVKALLLVRPPHIRPHYYIDGFDIPEVQLYPTNADRSIVIFSIDKIRILTLYLRKISFESLKFYLFIFLNLLGMVEFVYCGDRYLVEHHRMGASRDAEEPRDLEASP